MRPLVHAKKVKLHSFKGWTSYVQKPLISSKKTEIVVYKPRPKTMDEASVFLLHREGPKTEDQTKPNKKENK